ncbi:MAG TPA: hypothetical protein VG055_24505 [Planctomycetaceae bacterium]|jgi:hypothetical protein|nr:hypothetical protein [Planctomycetaceae bacterium]
MSETALPNAADRPEPLASGTARPLRPAIAGLLSQLKRRIRVYVLMEGTALVLIVLLSAFWLTLGIDWAYFRASGLELPVWFRESVAISALVLAAAGALFWIGLRLFRRFRARALALVLERRFPEMGSRLITAVEAAEARGGQESQQGESRLTAAMLERTIDEAVRLSASLPIESVFDRTPLRRALTAASVLLLSIGALAVVEPRALARWGRAFVARDATYWARETRLVVKAIVQPGDRLREFRGGQLKHPRGVDLTLLVEAADGTAAPDNVELNYVLDAGRGAGRIDMVKSNENQFRHTLSGLLDSLSLWVSGGDYVSRTPLRVEIVEPPRFDRVSLDCDYPSYTGLDRDTDGKVGRKTVEVEGSQVSLPMETSFLFHARANKPLVGLRIETDALRISLSREGGRIARKNVAGELGPEQLLLAPAEESFLSRDGLNAALPFVLTTRADPKKANATGQRVPPADKAPTVKAEPLADSITLPIAIPADTRLRMELEDTDDILSVEPIRIVINGVVDTPPAITTELRGIGTSITRKATVPIAGAITDDYGVAKAQFEFRIGKDKPWQAYPFRHPPGGSPKNYALQRDEADKTERFQVLPLDLKIGQKLSLCVSAEDGDNVNGPHKSRGEEYVFQIVSDEDLLAILYVKEVNLRERFERIIAELDTVQKDLIEHRGRAQATAAGGSRGGKPSGESESFGDLQTDVAVCAVRSLHQIRKSSVETASVEESFRGLLEELVNNAVHTQQMVERIGERIVQPLHQANEKDFPAADEALGLFKLEVDAQRDAVPRIDASIRAVANVVSRLKLALAEMQDLVKFHEAIARLQKLIKDQDQIIDATKQEQKRTRLKELKGLELK